jgi:hypothetical protein
MLITIRVLLSRKKKIPIRWQKPIRPLPIIDGKKGRGEGIC